MAIQLIDKIAPFNDGFVGMVDAKQVIGGASNRLPDATLPALTGDVTTSEGAVATTIANGAVTEAKMTLADNTTNNASSSKHGFLLKLENSGSKFLRDDGTWQTAGGGSAELSKGAVAFIIDGQGSVITTGSYGSVICPYAGSITGWDLVECSSTPISSSIVLDIWKDTYANYPPAVADTIWGTKPALSSATKNQATGLSIAVTAGDIFKVNVDSVTNAKKVLLVLKTTKS